MARKSEKKEKPDLKRGRGRPRKQDHEENRKKASTFLKKDKKKSLEVKNKKRKAEVKANVPSGSSDETNSESSYLTESAAETSAPDDEGESISTNTARFTEESTRFLLEQYEELKIGEVSKQRKSTKFGVLAERIKKKFGLDVTSVQVAQKHRTCQSEWKKVHDKNKQSGGKNYRYLYEDFFERTLGLEGRVDPPLVIQDGIEHKEDKVISINST